MNIQSIFLPAYSVGGHEVYENIPEVVMPYGKKIVVIGGEKAMQAARPHLEAVVRQSELEIMDYIHYGEDVTYGAAEALMNHPTVQAAEVVFAVGGGRAMDTCKLASDKLNKPLFTFPTIASNCAALTLVCIMHKEDHSFDSYYYRREPAKHCFINLQIIAEAPSLYLWAGIGDALSKQFEIPFASRGITLDHSNQIGVDMAKHSAEPLFRDAVKSMESAKQGVVDKALREVTLNIIVTGALISILVDTEKYNGACAHAIFYGSTVLEVCNTEHLHGEIVAYGVLVQTAVDQDKEQMQRVFNLNRALGLPVCLKDIGVRFGSEDYQKLLRATAANSCLDVVPFPITEEILHQAITQLEQYDLS